MKQILATLTMFMLLLAPPASRSTPTGVPFGHVAPLSDLEIALAQCLVESSAQSFAAAEEDCRQAKSRLLGSLPGEKRDKVLMRVRALAEMKREELRPLEMR